MKIITRTVLLLSMVSFLNDISSEMLYPVIPVYLKSIGFSVVLIGILEGIAEMIAGLSKGYFGKMSDNMGTRLPFVREGYALSAISKPMMAIFTFPAWIFTARSFDKIGKGIRTGARDAMLSDEATPQSKGKVFGFHRSMDTSGAVIGPAVALLFLYMYPSGYKTLFYLSFIPGIISIMFTFFIKSKTPAPKQNNNPTGFFDFIKYWKISPPAYRKLVIGFLLFALINSSDMFLILLIKENGMSDTAAIGVYIFYNMVYAAFSYPLGGLADKIGFKKVFTSGLLAFALVYMGMSFGHKEYQFFVLFFIYGVFTAATEGVSKAWITNVTDRKDTATAIGTYTGFQSVCSLIASSIAGLIWYQFGAATLFIATGCVAIVILCYFHFRITNN